MWLKQSTAVTIKMGPFVDSTDGNTEETALTISQADIRLSKNGGAFAQTNNATGATHDEKGVYGIPLDTTDTNTLGMLKVHIHETGALPVWQEFMIVPANVWDSLFGADKLQVHADEITAGLITATAIAADAITAAKVAADVTTEIQSGLATAAALDAVDNFLDTEIADIQARLPAALSAAGWMKSDLQTVLASASAATMLNRWSFGVLTGGADSGTTTTMVDAALTQATDVFAGSVILFCNLGNAKASRVIDSFNPATDTITWLEPLPTAITTEDYIILQGGYNLNIENIIAIKAKTDGLPSDPADASDVAAAIAALTIPSAAAVADAVWDEAIAGHLAAGSTGAVLDAIQASATNLELTVGGLEASLTTIDNYLDTEVANIENQVTELYLDLIDGGRLDLLLDSIKAILGTPVDTDLATDISNISAGSGLDAAGVRDAIGLAEANLDVQLAQPFEANVTKVNDIEVTGSGTREAPWKPV